MRRWKECGGGSAARRNRLGHVARLALIAVSVATPVRAQSGYVTMSDSARIFYKILGRGADTIVAIHGGPGLDHESIARDFAVLGQRHTVIFYDQRGGGKSTLPTDTSSLVVARQVKDLDELRRHFGLAKVTLVAHSYGPLLAASYALAHPSNVSRMVFFGPVPPRRGNFWQRFGESQHATRRQAARGNVGGGAADDEPLLVGRCRAPSV